MKANPDKKPWILPAIVISQFFCTSLWFAGNAVLADIVKNTSTNPGFLANLTSSVQFGFISGTLVFAVLAIADRYSPSKIFLSCSVIAAVFNLGICIDGISPSGLFLFRFFTGFFLAGIYPVGMKIAADHFQSRLGRSLGFLVGALVIGTSFPHFIKGLSATFYWKEVIVFISTLSALGGMIMWNFVPDGPYRKTANRLKITAFINGFRNPHFRAVSFGYFGHMWELYSFWTFVPVMLQVNKEIHHHEMNVSLLSFFIIACGGIACVLGGWLSGRYGVKRIASGSLLLSGLCCLLSPLFMLTASVPLLIAFLVFWGLVVIADSPLFSTLVAQHVQEEIRGSSLTIVNCIGFSITIFSIQVIRIASEIMDPQYVYLLLAIGPALGLVALYRDKQQMTKLNNQGTR